MAVNMKRAGHRPRKNWRKRPVVRFLSWTCAALFLAGIAAMGGVILNQDHNSSDAAHP